MEQRGPRVDSVQAISANQREQRGQSAGAEKRESTCSLEKMTEIREISTYCREIAASKEKKWAAEMQEHKQGKASHGDLQPSRDPITE